MSFTIYFNNNNNNICIIKVTIDYIIFVIICKYF